MMMPGLIKKVVDVIIHNQNQFASGGLLLMAIGAVGAYLRNLPAQIYEHFLHLFSMTVVITDDSKAFLWFKWWFREHERSKKIRHVDIITPRGPQGLEVMFFPAPGSHWFMYGHRPFRMTFTRAEEKKALYSETRPETLTLRVIGRDQKFLRKFIKDVQDKYDANNKEYPSLYFWSNSYWDDMPFTLRPWDSVILPKDLKADLVQDITTFQNSRAWYESTGMPYHRSYLLYGPPGTGKTSTLLGLASLLKKSIYLVKLAHMTDDGLVQALHRVEKESIVVFEDIDCLNHKRSGVTKEDKPDMRNPGKKKKQTNKEKEKTTAALTLSGLLNALDGIETPQGSMFFMTTNLIDKLDAALLRPGRVDKKIYLGPATMEQKVDMFQRFFPNAETDAALLFVNDNPKLKTTAEFQESLKLKKGEEKGKRL